MNFVFHSSVKFQVDPAQPAILKVYSTYRIVGAIAFQAI
jgi:hypothetical protein